MGYGMIDLRTLAGEEPHPVQGLSNQNLLQRIGFRDLGSRGSYRPARLTNTALLGLTLPLDLCYIYP